MIITQRANEHVTATDFHLTGNAINNDGRPRSYQVAAGNSSDLLWYLTSAELSELGHRLIELAAQAEEREQGVEAVA